MRVMISDEDERSVLQFQREGAGQHVQGGVVCLGVSSRAPRVSGVLVSWNGQPASQNRGMMYSWASVQAEAADVTVINEIAR